MSDTDLEDVNLDEIDLTPATHDDLGRVYYNDDVNLPSVSTVLSVRPDPPALKAYKEKHKDDEGYTDFFLDRGTLAHYEALNPLIPDELWSEDEQSSEEALQQHQEYWDEWQENKEWILNTWELIKTINGIDEDSVLAVEHAVANFEVGYAGRLDLLYVDDDNNVVLADLKISKDVYDKYLYQAIAYDKALDLTIDRYEIIRMHPGQKVWEVSRSDEWVDNQEKLWDEFKEFRAQLSEERIQKIREEASDDE